MSAAPGKPPRRARQQGIALLVILFAFISGAGALLASRFDAERVRLAREQHDRDVLLRAKQALIARATVDANNPGSLRCPDGDNDGRSELGFPCGLGFGRLPWQTLDAPDLRDSAGERLWYAVTPALLEQAAAVNSETPAALSVDGLGGVAAVIVAPGPALGAQTGRALNPNAIAQFLEGENADLDNQFTALTSAAGNDRVIAIGVAELMRGAHRRALRFAEQAVRDHLALYGFNRFIWLAPFANPALADYMAVAGTREGLLPVHLQGLPYTSDYNVAWSLTGTGLVLNPGPNTLTLAELSSNNRQVAAASCSPGGGPLGQFNCVQPASTVQFAGLPAGVVSRQFEFNLPLFTDPAPTLSAPSAGAVAARNLTLPAGTTSGGWILRITDRDAGGVTTGGGTVTLDGGTVGPVSVNGLHLAPVVDPASWYIANDWHQLVYMAVAPGFAPGAPGNCGAGCLTLLNGPPALNDKPALLLAAGAALAGARPSPLLADYLEADNATPGDDVFATGFTGAAFNDAVLILAGP